MFSFCKKVVTEKQARKAFGWSTYACSDSGCFATQGLNDWMFIIDILNWLNVCRNLSTAQVVVEPELCLLFA